MLWSGPVQAVYRLYRNRNQLKTNPYSDHFDSFRIWVAWLRLHGQITIDLFGHWLDRQWHKYVEEENTDSIYAQVITSNGHLITNGISPCLEILSSYSSPLLVLLLLLCIENSGFFHWGNWEYKRSGKTCPLLLLVVLPFRMGLFSFFYWVKQESIRNEKLRLNLPRTRRRRRLRRRRWPTVHQSKPPGLLFQVALALLESQSLESELIVICMYATEQTRVTTLYWSITIISSQPIGRLLQSVSQSVSPSEFSWDLRASNNQEDQPPLVHMRLIAKGCCLQSKIPHSVCHKSIKNPRSLKHRVFVVNINANNNNNKNTNYALEFEMPQKVDECIGIVDGVGGKCSTIILP